jgi:uncharacterized membrane protein
VRRLWFADHVVASLWFVPMCVGIVAYALSRSSIWVDRNAVELSLPEWLFSGDADAAAQITSTLTAAMLAFLAVVFSTTLVAVQLASSQYSPRIVRVFVRSKVTQATLATFLASFVVAINAMAATRSGRPGDVPVLTISMLYVMVLATVAMFVVFFHRIIRLLRVQYLFLSIGHESQRVIEADFPPLDSYAPVPEPAIDPTPEVVLHHGTPGVLQAIDVGGLAEAARAAGVWVELRVAVGDHLGYRTPVAHVHGGVGAATGVRVERYVLVGGERTQLQDPAFGIRQLVDAACRALSPAVNDPTTAVQSAHRIADLLARIGERPDPTGWYTDRDGSVRVRLVEDDFERLVVLGFTEITRYGADSPQVVRALRSIQAELRAKVDDDRRAVVDRLTAQLDLAVAESMRSAFRDLSGTPDRLGLG